LFFFSFSSPSLPTFFLRPSPPLSPVSHSRPHKFSEHKVLRHLKGVGLFSPCVSGFFYCSSLLCTEVWNFSDPSSASPGPSLFYRDIISPFFCSKGIPKPLQVVPLFFVFPIQQKLLHPLRSFFFLVPTDPKAGTFSLFRTNAFLTSPVFREFFLGVSLLPLSFLQNLPPVKPDRMPPPSK